MASRWVLNIFREGDFTTSLGIFPVNSVGSCTFLLLRGDCVRVFCCGKASQQAWLIWKYMYKGEIGFLWAISRAGHAEGCDVQKNVHLLDVSQLALGGSVGAPWCCSARDESQLTNTNSIPVCRFWLRSLVAGGDCLYGLVPSPSFLCQPGGIFS